MSLSYSKLSCYLRCPRQYQLLYLDRVPVLASPALFLGGTCHEALGTGFIKKIEGRILSTQEVADTFSTAWDNNTFLEDEEDTRPSVDWSGEDKGMWKDTGIALVSKYWEQVQPRVEPVEVELSLEREVDGILLRGRLDLIVGDGGWVDWKTSARAMGAPEIQRHIQPTVYSLLLGAPTKGAFHQLVRTKNPYCNEVKFERTQRDLDWFRMAVLGPVARAISEGHFPANPTGFFCGEGCECYHYCKGG